MAVGLALTTFLSACGTKPAPIIVTPPAALMQDCAETPVTLRVNGDLAVKVRVLKADLKRCNVDKASLRAWAKDTAK